MLMSWAGAKKKNQNAGGVVKTQQHNTK